MGSGPGGMFGRLWAAVTVSGLGDGVRAGALPLLAAFLTRSPGQIAGVAFAQALPWLLFGLPSGAIADRLDRRLVLITANVVRAVIMATVAVTVAFGHTPLALLYGAAFCLTTVTVFADSASQAILPDIVSTDQLDRANGRLYTSETTIAQFAGPPLGSLLFAVNNTVPFAVDSASFLASAAVLRSVRVREGSVPREGIVRGIGTALAWLRHQQDPGARAGDAAVFGWGSSSIGAALAGVIGQAVGIDWSAIAGCAAIVVTGIALAPFLRTGAIARLRAANAAGRRFRGGPR